MVSYFPLLLWKQSNLTTLAFKHRQCFVFCLNKNHSHHRFSKEKEENFCPLNLLIITFGSLFERFLLQTTRLLFFNVHLCQRVHDAMKEKKISGHVEKRKQKQNVKAQVHRVHADYARVKTITVLGIFPQVLIKFAQFRNVFLLFQLFWCVRLTYCNIVFAYST